MAVPVILRFPNEATIEASFEFVPEVSDVIGYHPDAIDKKAIPGSYRVTKRSHLLNHSSGNYCPVIDLTLQNELQAYYDITSLAI